MRAFVVEAHDGETDDSMAVAGDERRRVAVVHEHAYALCSILPTETGFDQIARQGSHRFRVAPACKLQRDITRAHGYDFAIIRLRLRRNRPPRMMS